MNNSLSKLLVRCNSLIPVIGRDLLICGRGNTFSALIIGTKKTNTSVQISNNKALVHSCFFTIEHRCAKQNALTPQIKWCVALRSNRRPLVILWIWTPKMTKLSAWISKEKNPATQHSMTALQRLFYCTNGTFLDLSETTLNSESTRVYRTPAHDHEDRNTTATEPLQSPCLRPHVSSLLQQWY